MKNKHKYHPPTKSEVNRAASRLSYSDERAIRAGIRAATGGVSGNITETPAFAFASMVTSNPPEHVRDLITMLRVAGDRVIGDSLPGHILFDIFGGDMVRANKAFEEFDKASWYLDYIDHVDAEHNALGESMLRNLSPDAKLIVRAYINDKQFDDDPEQRAYILGLVSGSSLSHQPDERTK